MLLMPVKLPNNMLTRDQLIHLIDQHNLTEHKDFILQHSKPAIHITREYVPNEDDLPIGASKIGGNPDLPADFVWFYADGQPLHFILQIRMADIKEIDKENQLPHTGWLYIFYDYDRIPPFNEYEDKEGIVVYIADESTPLTRIPHPEQEGYYGEISALRSFQLSFHRMLTPPTLSDFRHSADNLEEASRKHYFDLLSNIERKYKPLHYLLGIANSIQEELSIQAWNEIDRKYTEYNLAPEVKQWINAPDRKWRLLFQIDSDYIPHNHYNLSFGDLGRLYIIFRERDLVKRQFENVHFIIQCY
jgi:uncharacterized protein YwqG